MSIENLQNKLPDYAKDLKLNLSTYIKDQTLSEQRLWGIFLAAAAATRNKTVLKEIAEEAADILSAEAYNAALAAASIMGMNNVFYSARESLNAVENYDDIPVKLRMNFIGNPGIEKTDFESYVIAVSAINHCSKCLQAHAATLRNSEISREEVLTAIKIAAIISGVAQAIEIVEAANS